jgi:hypothetical protein
MKHEKYRPDLGVDKARVTSWNNIIKSEANSHKFHVLMVDDFINDDPDVIDIRHYQRVVFERISLKIESILKEI